MRATLEQIVAEPNSFPRDVDPRLGLYAVFNDVTRNLNRSQLKPASASDKPSDPRVKQLSKLPLVARQALLLTALDDFSYSQTGYILGISEPDAKGLVSEASQFFVERSTNARVLLLGPPYDMREVARVVSTMGHQVIGPFEHLIDAVTRSRTSKPSLVVAEVATAEQALTIGQALPYPSIFLTKNYDVLMDAGISGAALVLSEPVEADSLRTEITRALFIGIDPFTVADDDIELSFKPPNSLTRTEVEKAARARPGPVDAVIVGGQLRLAQSEAPLAKIPLQTLAGLAQDYIPDIKRLLVPSSNLGPGFTARFGKLGDLLDRPLTEQNALRIANQVAALQSMMPAIDESLAPETAQDVKALIHSISLFSRQFPVWKEFIAEADHAPPLSVEERKALDAITESFLSQPDQLVAPELKDAIAETRANSSDSNKPAAELAFVRAIANPLRALLRFAANRAKGAGKEFNKELETELGKLLAKGFGSILVGTSMSLLTLAIQHPEFAWLGPVLAMLNLTRK